MREERNNDDVVVMDDGAFYNHMKELEAEAIAKAHEQLKAEGIEIPEE
jgi:(2Fe-2S) ferredoxin